MNNHISIGRGKTIVTIEKIVSRTTLMLFSLMLTTAYYAPNVKAQGMEIHIRANGSIDPPSAPIFTADNITYTLTDDITGWIIVERNNIVLDGERKVIYTYDPGGFGGSVTLFRVSNVTVHNINIDAAGPGSAAIFLDSSSNCTFKESNIMMSEISFYMWNSSNNTIVENNVAQSILACFNLYGGSTRNSIYHNNFQWWDPNIPPVYTDGSRNSFNVDYPWGGNYWSGYFDQDMFRGELQDVLGSDGIWDHPYGFDANNMDRYPFTQIDGWKAPSPPYPVITRVTNTPLMPGYNEEALVKATIIDDVAVDYALLSYTQAVAWHNVSMNRLGDLFNASIPTQLYSTLVQYKIYAVDTGGNWSVSSTYSYTVGDSVAPQVVISQIPAYPLPMQAVTVYADVIEPVDASGVKPPVFFSYRVNSGSWWNTTMVFNSGLGLYEATIPAHEKHDFVEYFIKALDNVGNINITSIHHYEVLRCDIDHNGIVDVNDVYRIAKAWGLTAGEQGYNPEADINEDSIIEHQDLEVVSIQYGKDP